MSRIGKKILFVVAVVWLINYLLILIVPDDLKGILCLGFFPSFVIIVAIGAIIENKNMSKTKSMVTDEEKTKLEIIGTQYDSEYDDNYQKKLIIVLSALFVIAAIIIVMIFFADEIMENIISDKFSNIMLIVAAVVFFSYLLIANFIRINKKVTYMLSMKKFIYKKYKNCSMKELNNEYYPNGNNYLQAGITTKIEDNFLIEIPNLVTVKNFQIYHIERSNINYDGTYDLIPTGVTKLYRNVLEYNYIINKNMNCITKDFRDISLFQNNMELICNVEELLKTRILEFKISNNILTITKIIKNSNIKKVDINKDIDDIEIFKLKIVDVINR